VNHSTANKNSKMPFLLIIQTKQKYSGIERSLSTQNIQKEIKIDILNQYENIPILFWPLVVSLYQHHELRY
jgi:hypothetical protein